MDEYNDIRKNPRYQGQLAYLKEFLLRDYPNIDERILSERLDVTKDVAKLLLYDCYQGYSDGEEEQKKKVTGK